MKRFSLFICLFSLFSFFFLTQIPADAAQEVYKGKSKAGIVVTMHLDRSQKPGKWWVQAETSISVWNAYIAVKRNAKSASGAISGMRKKDNKVFKGSVTLSCESASSCKNLYYENNVSYEGETRRYADKILMKPVN